MLLIREMRLDPLAKEIGAMNGAIVLGLSFGTLLLVTYFKYDKNPWFRDFGDIFIKISFAKRDKRDLLVFALIPFAIGMFALIGRFILM